MQLTSSVCIHNLRSYDTEKKPLHLSKILTGSVCIDCVCSFGYISCVFRETQITYSWLAHFSLLLGVELMSCVMKPRSSPCNEPLRPLRVFSPFAATDQAAKRRSLSEREIRWPFVAWPLIPSQQRRRVDFSFVEDVDGLDSSALPHHTFATRVCTSHEGEQKILQQCCRTELLGRETADWSTKVDNKSNDRKKLQRRRLRFSVTCSQCHPTAGVHRGTLPALKGNRQESGHSSNDFGCCDSYWSWNPANREQTVSICTADC